MKIGLLLAAVLLCSPTLAAEILLRHGTLDVAPLLHTSRARLASHPNPIPESVEPSQRATNLLSIDADRPVRVPTDNRDLHRQWLVHIKSPITAATKRQINDHIAPYKLSSTYLPHDTFLLVAPRDVAEAAHDAPGVLYVAEFAAVFKHDSNVDDRVLAQLEKRHKKLALPGELSTVKLHVSLAPTAPSASASASSAGATTAAQARFWISEIAKLGFKDVGLENVPRDRDFAVLHVPRRDVHHIIRNLASFHEIHWVEVAPKMSLMNKFTHAIVQSGAENNYTMRPIWDRGLRGEGQVVGIADTGIDADMCFFADANNAVPFGTVNMNHRKIVTYVSLGSDRQDEVDGHGTHTSGTLAGDVLLDGSSSETETFLAGFNGHANKAKLAFYDLGTADEFEVPDDLYEDFYMPAYELTGARIHSNSWGATVPYGALSFQTDRFVHDFPDFLPVYAAGNDGTDGLFTIASPSVAKNALAVGASTNSAASFFATGSVVGMEVSAPAAAAGSYRLVPASFGPSVLEERYATLLRDVRAAVASPFDACNTITNAAAVNGRVAFVERGTCSFYDKVVRCQRAGAIMCVVINTDGEHLVMGVGQNDNANAITIPAVLVNDEDGAVLRANAANLVLRAPAAIDVPEFRQNLLADFSSRGPSGDGRFKPDIVAPGQFVMSARSDGNPTSNNCDEDSLLSLQGTSMATPLAAGAVAITREYFTKGYYPSGVATSTDALVPSASLLKAVMINCGQTITSVTEQDPILDLTPPSVYQGYGQIKMDSVLRFDDSNFDMFLSDSSSVAPLESNTYCFNVRSWDVPFKVTLVWTDPPPSPSSLRLLVNNLDLTVAHAETEEMYIGNNIHFVDTAGTLFKRHDDINNVEQVWLEPGSEANQPSMNSQTNPETGVYVVRVIGFGVPVGEAQNYSLVVTGDFDLNATDASCDAFPDTNICPRNCTDHGQCVDGRCECANGYFSTDCSQVATTLQVNNNTQYEGSLQSSGWEFFRIELDPNDQSLFGGDNSDHVVKVFMNRLGATGDPDFYVALNTWPTLEYHNFSNTECDPCSDGTTRHVTDIDPSRLRPAVGEVDVTNEMPDMVPNPALNSTTPQDPSTVTLVVGMYGFCCEGSTFSLRVGTGLPEGGASDADGSDSTDSTSAASPGGDNGGGGLPGFVVAIIVVVGLACVGGIAYLCIRKRNRGSAHTVQGHDRLEESSQSSPRRAGAA